jgi:energy-coupling factor transporter ATP-binding protein EcfA2
MVRQLELAKALVNAPELLVLDEPTVGLDPIARAGVWEHISRLRERAGMTVLMTTHHMEEADLYCDRIALIHRGRIQATGTTGRAEPGPADGHRPGHHHAAVLQLQRAVPDRADAWLAAGHQPDQPAVLRGDALRWLLIGVPTNIWLDVGVLISAATAGVIVSSALLPRLAT